MSEQGGLPARTPPRAAAMLLIADVQPDTDAFFGGLEAAVADGGIWVALIVVVMAVRRLTS